MASVTHTPDDWLGRQLERLQREEDERHRRAMWGIQVARVVGAITGAVMFVAAVVTFVLEFTRHAR